MNEERVRAFVAADYRKVVAAVALVCGDTAGAEDAVQEALARAWEQEARGVTIDRLAAWVTTVAMNLGRTSLRRRGAERRAVDRLTGGLTDRSSVGVTESRGDVIAVRAAVAQLPRRQRQAIVLRYYLGESVLDVASALGIAEGTAKALLHQARAGLREQLGSHSVEEVVP